MPPASVQRPACDRTDLEKTAPRYRSPVDLPLTPVPLRAFELPFVFPSALDGSRTHRISYAEGGGRDAQIFSKMAALWPKNQPRRGWASSRIFLASTSRPWLMTAA